MNMNPIIRKRIKQASKFERINTKNAIIKKVLEEVDGNKYEQVDFYGQIDLYGKSNSIIIGGYENPESGRGPYGALGSRIVARADYSAKQIQTLSNVDLLNFFWMQSNELKQFLRYEENNVPDENKITLSSGPFASPKKNIFSATKYKIKKDNTYIMLEKMISDVKKDGLSYVGDISLISSINLGHGWTYLDNHDSNITTKEALMPGNNDGYRLKSIVNTAYQKMNTFSEFMQSITKEKPETTKILTVWNS